MISSEKESLDGGEGFELPLSLVTKSFNSSPIHELHEIVSHQVLQDNICENAIPEA